jgi:hypothetical protein
MGAPDPRGNLGMTAAKPLQRCLVRRAHRAVPTHNVAVPRLQDRAKRKRTFKTEREARLFEASLITRRATGDVVDPPAGRVTLATISWIASRPVLSPKVRVGYEGNWLLRVEPRFGSWPVAKIDHDSIQTWVNDMSASGLARDSIRWTPRDSPRNADAGAGAPTRPDSSEYTGSSWASRFAYESTSNPIPSPLTHDGDDADLP